MDESVDCRRLNDGDLLVFLIHRDEEGRVDSLLLRTVQLRPNVDATFRLYLKHKRALEAETQVNSQLAVLNEILDEQLFRELVRRKDSLPDPDLLAYARVRPLVWERYMSFRAKLMPRAFEDMVKRIMNAEHQDDEP